MQTLFFCLLMHNCYHFEFGLMTTHFGKLYNLAYYSDNDFIRYLEYIWKPYRNLKQNSFYSIHLGKCSHSTSDLENIFLVKSSL